MTSFLELGVPARLHDVLTNLNIQSPTPIQAATLPDALLGRDVLGRGRTGSGKTLAFLLPLVTRLSRHGVSRPGAPRALILAPTRELVSQIDTVLQPLAKAAGLTSCTVFGGVGQNPQAAAIRRGVDIVVACPGRLEDLVTQGLCRLDGVQITVLDEADHMADLGFLPGVRRLLAATPADGQRLFFSATLDRAVDALVRQFLNTPVTHEADSAQSPVGTMDHHVLAIDRELRLPILVDLASAPGRTVVFTRTKYGAKALARQLNRAGVTAVELHGNLSQNARTRNLDDFHAGRVSALVATDIAARGIHVDNVTLVIHADPPADHKTYLHRSGRTARAGEQGTVVTLMMPEQRREVTGLAKAAGIAPTTTSVASAEDPLLAKLAPGVRTKHHVATSPSTTRPSTTRPSTPKKNAHKKSTAPKKTSAHKATTRHESARHDATRHDAAHAAAQARRRNGRPGDAVAADGSPRSHSSRRRRSTTGTRSKYQSR